MDEKDDGINRRALIIDEITDICRGNKYTARILINRGMMNPDYLWKFVNPEVYTPASYTEFRDIKKVCSVIHNSVMNGELICIYGDYDTDGITSTAILTEYLKSIEANAIYHIPDRFEEGYGLNFQTINDLSLKGVKLIITCDCGISGSKEIRQAYSLGMRVVVTDHHDIPDKLPECEGIINPKMFGSGHPMRYICGAAVAFYLISGLDDLFFRKGGIESYLDLVCIATIGDVVPLLDENRYLLQKGIPFLRNTQRKGLRELFHISRLGMDSFTLEDIAFKIVPRINASGRIYTARSAVELMLCDDIQECFLLSTVLNGLNETRRKIQSQIIEEAESMIKNDSNIIVLYNEKWHHGVIGIAASRLCEVYGKPVILLSLKEDKTTVVGSARSVEDISIIEILNANNMYLIKYGGHKSAAGLSLNVNKVQEFIDSIEEYGQNLKIKCNSKRYYDMQVRLEEINENLYCGLKMLAPYGHGFGEPVFLCKGVKIQGIAQNSNEDYKRFIIEDGTSRMNAFSWNVDYVPSGKLCDVIFKVRESSYKGKVRLELLVQDIMEQKTEEARL